MAKKKALRRRKPDTPEQFRQERITFVTPKGTRDLYRKAAELEGVSYPAWLRSVLRQAVLSAFEAHGVEPDELPPVHFQRPPRLQPRLEDPAEPTDPES